MGLHLCDSVVLWPLCKCLEHTACSCSCLLKSYFSYYHANSLTYVLTYMVAWHKGYRYQLRSRFFNVKIF